MQTRPTSWGSLHGAGNGFEVLSQGNVNITVNRRNLLGSIQSLTLGLKHKGRFRVAFTNEKGIDAGGPSREFFDLIGRELKAYNSFRTHHQILALAFLSPNPRLAKYLIEHLGGKFSAAQTLGNNQPVQMEEESLQGSGDEEINNDGRTQAAQDNFEENTEQSSQKLPSVSATTFELLRNLGGLIANSIRSGFYISCPLGLLVLREMYSNRLKNKCGYSSALVRFTLLESELNQMFSSKNLLKNATE